jgi:hypothetical protein
MERRNFLFENSGPTVAQATPSLFPDIGLCAKLKLSPGGGRQHIEPSEAVPRSSIIATCLAGNSNDAGLCGSRCHPEAAAAAAPRFKRAAATPRAGDTLAAPANLERAQLQTRAEGLAFPIWSYLSCYPARLMASPHNGREILLRVGDRRRWHLRLKDASVSRNQPFEVTSRSSRPA